MGEMDLDPQLVAGEQSVETVTTTVEAEQAANETTTTVDVSGPVYDGLVEGSRYRKQTWGDLKEPKAAAFRVQTLEGPPSTIALSTQFILTTVTEIRREKANIISGFDEEKLLSVFGGEAKMYQLQGVLMDLAGSQDWTLNMKEFYEKYLRATQLVKTRRIAVLEYSNRWVSGYPLNFQNTNTSAEFGVTRFGMEMFVRRDRRRQT